MRVIPLSEGAFTIDHTKQFIPFEIGKDNLQQRSTGSLLVEIQPFIVITEKDILLLDTGLGFSYNGKLQIHQLMMDAGINPSEITKVLMSHLHKDHAGAIGIETTGELAFPNATYYVNKNEWEFANAHIGPSYFEKEIHYLANHPKVFFTEDEGSIDGYITYKVTGAHSNFHQVFWIKEDQEIIFFGGDDAPQLQQMKHRYAAKYDFDGRKAMELRQQWWEQGEKEKWTFLFYHDIKNPVASTGQ